MNTLQITPLTDKETCYVCHEHKATNFYRFTNPRGYGSLFDSLDLRFQCCDECNRKRFEKWFRETPETDRHGLEKYTYERELYEYIMSLPVSSRELMFNGADGYKIDSQDWIDFELGELSDEKKAEYGLDDPMFDVTDYSI